MEVHWFGRYSLDLGRGSVDDPPRGAVFYEFERDGVTITRRKGYAPDSDRRPGRVDPRRTG
jgi:hypothetical protein